MDQAEQAAVLFADVAASTRLYEIAGDTVAAEAIQRCITLLKASAERAGGRVMRIVGDEILALFPSADAAARAATDMQCGIAGLPHVAGIRLGIRIGFNFGPVVERGGELFGDAVNIGARLADLAEKDQIITSADSVAALSAPLGAACRQLYSVAIKGREQEVQLCQLLWQQGEDSTFLMGAPTASVPANASLRLRYRAVEIVLDAARSTLALGRDKSAELVIEDSRASRAHCRVERRRNKFVLADHSANGTFVTVEGDPEVALRRDEFTLRNHGWIAFGQSRADTSNVVEFFCEG